MKSKKVLLRELRAELHYWQMQYRLEAKGLKATKAKVKTIGALMREVQKRVK